MRASDLLSCHVRTSGGDDLGRVSDFRAVQNASSSSGEQQAFRVDQLVVGRGGLADRLGYLRGRIRGPWLVRVVMQRSERRAWQVAVDDVEQWDVARRVLVLRPGAEPTHPQ